MLRQYLPKFQEERDNQNYAICQQDNSIWALTSMFYPPAETHSGPCQSSKIKFFARIVNDFKLPLLTNFAKVPPQMLEGVLN